MKIIETSEQLNATEIYKMTKSALILKMSEHAGEKVKLAKWCKYEDENSNGELQSLLSVMDENGAVYATNSSTFIREFEEMLNIFEDNGETLEEFEIVSGVSKSGRNFITCAI